MEEPEPPEQFNVLLDQLDMPDRLMFATDYPHWDFDAPDRVIPVRLEPGLRRAIMRDNALALDRLRPRYPEELKQMARHVVATADEIPPGGRLIVEVAGRSIGVFNIGGEYLAVRNRCPHQGGPLCEGVQLGALHSSSPGEYEYDRPHEIIRCPWHAWEFDLRTGASWLPSRAHPRALVRGRGRPAGGADRAAPPRDAAGAVHG